MQNSGERVAECTSAQFDGVIAIIDPDDSWVARWQRVNRYVKGIYAARVSGRPPPDVLDQLEATGMVYRPRDHTQED